MHDEFYSLTGKLKNILKILYGFSFVGERVWLALPCGKKSVIGGHCLAVGDLGTRLSANPKFSGKNFENQQKLQKRRSA